MTMASEAAEVSGEAITTMTEVTTTTEGATTTSTETGLTTEAGTMVEAEDITTTTEATTRGEDTTTSTTGTGNMEAEKRSRDGLCEFLTSGEPSSLDFVIQNLLLSGEGLYFCRDVHVIC